MTPGLVCGHHHLYSTLARGCPRLRSGPDDFLGILRQVWWRLDAALDLEMLRWSALLGAAEALMAGTTCIVDHHESPNAIEGSLSVIADACAEVGVRVSVAYGVTDRWGDDGVLVAEPWPPDETTDGARRGLAECERFLRAGGRGMVGVHAAFTCADGHAGGGGRPGRRPRVSACTCMSRKASSTRRPAPAWSDSPGTTGSSSTPCTSTGRFPARSSTTPART